MKNKEQQKGDMSGWGQVITEKELCIFLINPFLYTVSYKLGSTVEK